MKNYKISITKTYTINVLDFTGKTPEEELIQEAENTLDQAMKNGTEHHLQTGDTGFEVFDVTSTDDASTEEIL